MERNPIRCVTLLHDGKLASSADDKKIKIWNVSTGKVEKEILGNRTNVLSLACLNDDRLASGSLGGDIKIWDTKTGEEIKTIRTHLCSITSLAYLGDHKLACGAEDGNVKIVDIDHGKEIVRFRENFGRINCLIALRDGNLCSCSPDKTIRIWDASTGEWIRAIEAQDEVLSLAEFSNETLVAGLIDGRIKLWKNYKNRSEKVVLGEPDQVIRLYIEGPIASLAVLADGTLASGTTIGKVRVYNINKAEKSIKKLEGHSKGVKNLILLKNGLLSSASEDGRIQIWNVKKGELVRSLVETNGC